MNISLEKIRECLLEEQLLKEFTTTEGWSLSVPASLDHKLFDALSYDSRTVSSSTLFFCKGLNFKEDYLKKAVDAGLEVYIAEQPYDVAASLGIIVTDIKKAMAVLSMAFYDYPQNKMKLIGFTGTKGKTTAAYFTKFILDHATNKKTAMLSTMNSTLDGQTFFKSHLTTPESLDLYRMMAEAVDNQMTHFIMEVSSQAYKTNRVYGLFFDVGIFLNITPDHISPIEHPTFDDYFYCKRQLISHAKTMILNRDSDHFQLLKETAELHQTPYIVYGNQQLETDYVYQTTPDDSLAFSVTAKEDKLGIADEYHLRLGGDFNKGNALSAVIAASLVGADHLSCQLGIQEATVPGRMELLTHTNGAKVYVDYAHNYDSLKNLLTFVKEEHPDGRLLVVIGSTGNKAISRRKDFGTVLSELADIAILTTDDPADEEPALICKEIADYITAPIQVETITDRAEAIAAALSLSSAQDAVVLAGKGADLYQKVHGEDTPYEGDYAIADRLIKENGADVFNPKK
ncbi:UDP-N-acetylmuramoyl-L-alanyl-D-glutamate--L-lysine ligase [Enterococcus termitis]|uniref:UDP-N-acetylmuramoyl-L-alanyl-D-glutamate--L-lysine ligase n=1 Tax=Enterococcus termitis TaxID=332950 RepID=A0A1E5GDB2_9ENTE|nr:UDP-N-acetylmuramoyl-L-alanyl-D-glutamate--L-lysine ligase [Enterococcus termitis]OEG10641.1 UDP-N-acetylmuramoylalanyl-D-glutamate--L-lysine ligase [Enterococcus termitis]OJG97905.1 UDP-N-acetylmuramoyl-L-alanyl-D-glutamate-L-lysine ligase [Enterococcus termitis]